LRSHRNTSATRLQIDEVRTVHAVPPDIADGSDDLLYRDVTRLLDDAEIDPDDYDYPVETVELPDLSARLWKLNKARATVPVHSVFPCATCLRPITCLHLDGTEIWVIVDAVEHPEGSDSGADCWTANLFDTHRCPEAVQ
jgi:hypothetical protein